MSAQRPNPLLLQAISILIGVIAIVSIALSKFSSGPLILIGVGLALAGFMTSLVMVGRVRPRSTARVLGRNSMTIAKLAQQRSRLHEIGQVKTFGEPTVGL